MPGRRQRSSAKAQSPQPVKDVTLAVFHGGARGESVERHVAQLRRKRRVSLIVARQTKSVVPPRGTTGILWEISAGTRLDRRRVSELLERAPTASYSASADRHLGDLSRSLGFLHHLTLPLRWPEVERALGLPGAKDLADRMEAAGPKLKRLAARSDVIGDLLRAVNVSTEPHAVASALAARVSAWLPLARWAVIGVEVDGKVRWLVGGDSERTVKAAAEAIADQVVQSGVPYATDRVAGDRQVGEPIEAAAIGFPILANGAIVGVLVGFDHGRSRRVPRWSQAAKVALAKLLEPAGFALGHALRMARAEALSVTDDLTQLFNSRYLHGVLRKEVKRALRNERCLSLLFVDLDGFKKINDAHGHVLGSRALVEAAAVVRGAARETDVVARFGGDEFVVVLPEADHKGAYAVAERMRAHVARYVFLADHGGSRLTVSVGVATLPDVADSADVLLQAADAAMYRAKEAGRDGVFVARPASDGAGRASAD